MIKVVNGLETVIDTTILVPEDGDIQEILKGLNIGNNVCNIDSLMQTISLDIDLDENSGEKMVKMCVAIDGDDGTINIDSLLSSMSIDINENESGEAKIITATISGDCTAESKAMNKMIVISDDGEDVNRDEKVKIIKTEEGVIKVVVNDEGKKTITITNDKNLESEEDVLVYNIGDGDKKVIVKTMICKLSTEDAKTLKDQGVETLVDENSLEVENISFYPNPNNGKFNLKFNVDNKGNTEIKIYDINGKEVYNELLKNFKGNYDKAIDISTEGKGTYFLNITQNGKVLNKKIMIQ